MILNNKNKNINKEKYKKSLYNKNSKEKIADVQMAKSFNARLLGLMFKKDTDHPLLFEIPQNVNNRYRSSIHSLFMRFDLKLIFIDGNNIIYEIADLKPWHYHIPKKSAQYIIEFNKNNFNNYNLKIGDEIELK